MVRLQFAWDHKSTLAILSKFYFHCETKKTADCWRFFCVHLPSIFRKLNCKVSLFHIDQCSKRGEKKAPFEGPFLLIQFAFDFFAFENLDNIFWPNIVIVFKGHTAFLAGLDLCHFVLKAFQCLKRSFVDHDVVAQ